MQREREMFVLRVKYGIYIYVFFFGVGEGGEEVGPI